MICPSNSSAGISRVASILTSKPPSSFTVWLDSVNVTGGPIETPNESLVEPPSSSVTVTDTV